MLSQEKSKFYLWTAAHLLCVQRQWCRNASCVFTNHFKKVSGAAILRDGYVTITFFKFLLGTP